MVTEYISGTDLQTYFEKEGVFTSEQVKFFLHQMADALAYAHNQGIIHRDIKLSNILVDENSSNRRYILTDFGISRISNSVLTSKAFAGTYYYMSPEQLRGRPCKQSDLWALGVCAYTLLAGIKPFEGDTKEDLKRKITLSIPRLPSIISKNRNLALEDIIFRLLEKQVFNRTSSAEELLAKLNNISNNIVLKVQKKEVKSNVTSIDKEYANRIGNYWIWFWILTILSIICSFGRIIPGIIGFILFYKGQKKLDSNYTNIGIVFLLAGLFSPFVFSKTDNDINCVKICFLFLDIIFRFLIILCYSKIKKATEIKFFRNILLEGSKNLGKLLSTIKEYININPENLKIRQKYIELLFLNSCLKDAIVESKLVLEIDPYNLDINLLLANCYYEKGLYDECIKVCNGYLSISGYSFEFSELKKMCKKRE